MSNDLERLRAALQNLPLQHPEQDRLPQLLRALKQNQVARTAEPAKPRQLHRRWWHAMAASVAILSCCWWLFPQGKTAPELATTSTVAPSISGAQEISALIANSKLLEAQLRALGKRRASFRQLNALTQARLSLAALDSELAAASASNQQDALSEQRALWRERVAVLSAVHQGEYRPALYTVD